VAGSSAGVSANLSHQRTTSATINQQYTRLNVDIVPEEMRIYRESERNLDVSGNYLVSLTARVDPSRWAQDRDLGPAQSFTLRVTKLGLLRSNGSVRTPGDLQIEAQLHLAPPACPLRAHVYLLYELRRVTDNARSYVEGEQGAVYERRRYDGGEVEIVPAAVVRQASWQILGRGQPIMLRDALGRILPIDFASYEQAESFARWLDRHAAQLRGRSTLAVGSAGLALYAGDETLALPSGPYIAEMVRAPDYLPRQCAVMDTVNPPQRHR
jgi:hypothetical protein